MCGENREARRRRAPSIGSSPRVRGKRRPGTRSRRRTGLIPACAGKTPSGHGNVEEIGAHPRVCGENGDLLGMKLLAAGSSPRVRGKPPPASSPQSASRLIPACAGKTDAARVQARGEQAHPRVCGENFFLPLGATMENGSSPRVRGKPRNHSRTASRDSAHPRVCGENVPRPGIEPGSMGSSPRVRGKLVARVVGDLGARLIPACAGKTAANTGRFPTHAAHPRVCGENTS